MHINKETSMQDRELQPVRGMRDFYPNEMRQRQRLFDLWRITAERFGFEQYDASIVESLALLKRKAGEEITEQIYGFTDKSGRELALRPEMTPTLARMVLARVNSLPMPLKWFAIGQFFRYERMTRGRKREHYQLNLDIIGEPEQIAEAELIATALDILRNLNLTEKEIVVRVGSRQLLVDILSERGFNNEKIEAIFLAIDKRGKIPDEEIKSMLEEQGFSTVQIEFIFEILSIGSFEDVKGMVKKDSVGIQHMQQFMDYACMFVIEPYLQFDISIVRGLSYYTGIVFECFDRDSQFRAIFGGGRYDKLFCSMAGIDLPAAGMGFGDVVINEILKYYGKEIPQDKNLDHLVSYTDDSLVEKAVAIANKLRGNGHKVFLLYGPQRFKKALKFGSQIDAENLVLLDPIEVSQGKYIIKNLKTGVQENRVLGINLSTKYCL